MCGVQKEFAQELSYTHRAHVAKGVSFFWASCAAVALADPGAMHQRGIIANSEVRRLTALNANIKLLPVDVLSIRTNNSIEPRAPG